MSVGRHKESEMELKLNEVTKKYGQKVALDRFSYTFGNGIYGILGANGAGKSTLMNLITDNVKRDGGWLILRIDPQNKKVELVCSGRGNSVTSGC